MTIKDIKRFLVGILGIMFLLACDKETQGYSILSVTESPTMVSGSAYIQCETGPFYISHAFLDSCTTSLGFDSILSTGWGPGCSMSSIMVDTLASDFRFTYLSEGELVIEGTAQELEPTPFELIIGNDTMDTGMYPFYGALKYELNGLTYSFVLLNRYIGGCFHDELIWEIRS